MGPDLAGGRSENQEAVRDPFEESHLDGSGAHRRPDGESNEKAQTYEPRYALCGRAHPGGVIFRSHGAPLAQRACQASTVFISQERMYAGGCVAIFARRCDSVMTVFSTFLRRIR